MIERWCDTSALLNQSGLLEPQKELAISPITLAELEHIKNDDKYSEIIRYRAREAVRQIMTEHNFTVVMSTQKDVDKILRQYPFLNNINDHRILCEAELHGREQRQRIMFITSDSLQYLFACELPHIEAIYPMGDDLAVKKEEHWVGWGKYYPDEKEMALL